MKKRIAVGFLWTWMSWSVVLLLNGLFGVSEQFGFILAVAIGLFVGGDPMHRIWPRTETARMISAPTLEADPA